MRVRGVLDRIQPPGFEAIARRRLRSQLRRAERIDAVWPRAVLGSVGLLFSVPALIGLGYVAGKGWKAPLLVTISRPTVALGVGAALVLLAGWCVRRLLIERMVWAPGAILVSDLTVPKELSNVDGTQLSAAFRRRLTALRLQAPTPMPGATISQDFLEILDAEHLEPKNPIASLIGFLRATVPNRGYEVSASLVPPGSWPDGLRCGVAIQVTRLPREALPVQTAWASTWEEAVDQAVDIVTAAVLPRTRLSNRQPWSGWRRYPMPALLVHHYELAEELMRHRRYDEALDRYYHALELDPKSVDLRLHMGFVQEKLALFLDALATYEAAHMMAVDTSSKLYRRVARAERRASGRIACYRLAVLLGGPNLPHQWRKPPDDHSRLRSDRRSHLREGLIPKLIELLKVHGLLKENAGRPPERSPWDERAICDLLHEWGGVVPDDSDPRCLELRVVLIELGQKILRSVLFEVRRPWASRTLLSPLTVRLTIGQLDVRLDWVKRRWLELRDECPGPWNPRVEVEKQIKRTSMRSRLGLAEPPFRTPTERYNAGCLCAWPLLLGDQIAGDDREKLVKAAVDHLSHGLSDAASRCVAGRRDWILSEDPDLKGLRPEDKFKTLEAIYFPSPSGIPNRPSDARRWEQSCYINQLLATIAHSWETVWHRRRNTAPTSTDPHVVLSWYSDEEAAWQLVRKLAQDYRDWHTRLAAIDRINHWSVKYSFDPLRVPVPSYAATVASREELAEEQSRAKLDDKISAELRGNKRRLREIRKAIPGSKQLHQLQAELRDRDFWHHPHPEMFQAYVCDAHAAMWQRLREWLEEYPYKKHSEAARAFAAGVEQAASLTSTSHGSRTREVTRQRLQSNGFASNGFQHTVEAAAAATRSSR